MKQDLRATIWNELAARDWTPNDLARRMATNKSSAAVQRCALDLLFNIDDPMLHLGTDIAEDLGRVFDTSAAYWLNLEQAVPEDD